MSELATDFGYLAATLLGLPAVLLFIALGGSLRPTLWLAGTIQLLHVGGLVWFQGVYWSPERWGGGLLGLEDVLVSFEVGVGAWFFAIWPLRRRISAQIQPRRVLARVFAVALPSTAMAIVIWLAGAGVMEVLLIVMAATFTVLALLRPGNLRLAGAAVLFYTPVYWVWVYGAGTLFPGFFGIWDGPQLWGIAPFGLPLEETAWVMVYSATYPMILGYVFDVKLSDIPSGLAYQAASHDGGADVSTQDQNSRLGRWS